MLIFNVLTDDLEAFIYKKRRFKENHKTIFICIFNYKQQVDLS